MVPPSFEGEFHFWWEKSWKTEKETGGVRQINSEDWRRMKLVQDSV
jgi:hypothetical protein